MLNKRLLGWLSISAVVILLDVISKLAILQHFQLGEVRHVTDFFDLVLVYNPGAAFSFLADQPGWQRWFFIVLAFVVCIWLFTMMRQHVAEILNPAAFAFIIGGALGNVIDRIAYGAVVDFLSFHIGPYTWPAFNLADSAIFLGVFLMILAQIMESRRNKQASQSHPDSNEAQP